MPLVEAIIPFISRQASADFGLACALLQETVRSILALPEEFISVTIIGHDEPSFLENLKRVTWLPTPTPPPAKDASLTAKLGDSTNKRMAGVQHAYSRKIPWVLFSDADDLVSSRLDEAVDFENHDLVVLSEGYQWRTGSQWLLKRPSFHMVCGTSHFVRLSPQFFPVWLNGEADDRRLGDANHNEIATRFAANNHRVQMLTQPFGIYRLTGSNTYFRSDKSLLRGCATFLLRARYFSAALKREFSMLPTNASV